MIKFIYPLSYHVERRKFAWTAFNDFCSANDVVPLRTKLREETYHHDIIFVDANTNEPMKRRARLYTMSFALPQEDSNRLRGRLASTTHRHYRQITPQSVIILRDDNIKVDDR